MRETIRAVKPSEKQLLDKIVSLHQMSFRGFFLSSLHPGFLRLLYKSFTTHKSSELLVAMDGKDPVGFLAYSYDTTGAYKHMLQRYFFPFAWYSFLSFLKKPSIFFKMLSALTMPHATKREADYVKIFSIGVDPDCRKGGVGTHLMNELKKRIDFDRYEYITLETDAKDNDEVNRFYLRNGFRLSSDYMTFEGRRMNKYHFRRKNEYPVS